MVKPFIRVPCVASRPRFAELMASPRRPPFTGMALGRLVAGEWWSN